MKLIEHLTERLIPNLYLATYCFLFMILKTSPAVRVRWNNSAISVSPTRDNRILIYHDEINIRTTTSGANRYGLGVLTCRLSGNPGNPEWFKPASDTPIRSNNNNFFRIIRLTTESPTLSLSQLARTVPTPPIAMNEGLWTCNGGGLPRRHVALYRRGK